ALMDKVAVSRAVAKLLKTGRLAREFADQDRRRSILSLTEDGNRVHAEVAELALDYETKLLAGIADEDVERLGSLIDKLLDRARGLGAPSL
ncbi:MAG: MarR family transcriptional regulator, partial [Pseudomonadota bacterium]